MEGTKIAIFACFGLAAIGVGTDLWMRAALKKAKIEETTSKRLLSEVFVAKLDINELEREKENDKYFEERSKQNLNAFFEAKAKVDAKMALGPSVGPEQDDSGRSKGFVDTTRELTWGKGGARTAQRFERDKIAAFCYVVENTPLLKVTYLKLEGDPKSRDDLWVPTISVTERRPVTSEEAAPK